MIRLDTKDKPISKQEEKLQEMQYALNNLQGNILRGHGRKNSVNLFLRFQAGKETDVRALIRRLAEDGTITSALQQGIQSEQKYQDPHTLFCSFFLSAEGYRYLAPALLTKLSREFQRGIKGARERWNDPPAAWAQAEEYNFHAMILLAQADPQRLREAVQNMKEHFAPVIQCPLKDCKEEEGRGMEVNGKVVEHFGFADNISQPLFFEKDIKKQTQGNGGRAWDSSAGPNLVLVPDPYGRDNGCGSYLVFLKLEQNAQGFARKVEDLAYTWHLDPKIVRAFIMGRFQDGTPVALKRTDGMQGDLNDFSFFASDRNGTKCPFHAHIRKVNPRDDTGNARERRIVRRGITYGTPKKEPKDNPTPEEMPREGVGLLFMCYQHDIKNQFESLQFLQANNINFFQKHTGLDPVIGRLGWEPPPQKWPPEWGAPQAEHQPSSFGGFVTIKGGEYFFAPSMSFLKNL
jgi:Dyp-type peroxidase family